MSSPRQEDEVQPTTMQPIPKFASFQPQNSSPNTDTTDGSSAGKKSQGAKQIIVPKFSSFKPPVQKSRLSVPESQLDEAEKTRNGPQKRHRSRSSSRERRKSTSRDQIKESYRHHDKRRHRGHDDADERNRHRQQDKRRRSRSRERDLESSRNRDSETRRRHGERHTDASSRDNVVAPTLGEILPWDNELATSAQAFCIDRKGDPANLVYGTIHRYSIPQYYRFGKGQIIGLPPSIRIIQDKGDGKGLILSAESGFSEQYKRGSSGERKYRFALPEGDGLRKLKLITEGKSWETNAPKTEFDHGLEYIPLSSKRQKADEESAHNLLLFDVPHVSGHDLEEDVTYASSSDNEVDEMSAWNAAQIRQKQLEIQRRIDGNPSDVSAWLELVAHQDNVLYGDEGRKKKTTLAERKSTSEIKLSMLEKAMDKIDKKDRRGEERLWECWFDTASETWEPKKLLGKYQSVLRQNPTMHTVWVKYLNFRQTDFDSFKYSDMIKYYEQCLQILRTAIFHKDENNADIIHLETIALYVIFRGLNFLREAGYIEIAIASLQGILELNLFAPKSILSQYSNTHSSYENIMGQLETFWDSECLRAGEEGAEGWCRYVGKGNVGEAPEPAYAKTAEVGDFDSSDPFGWWAQKETESHERNGVWPARTTDEVEEDDPFKVILFSDIQRWMFIFRHETTKRLLLDYMLRFCKLPAWFDIFNATDQSIIYPLRDVFLSNVEHDSGDWFWPKEDGKAKSITWEGMEPEREGRIANDALRFEINDGYPITMDMLFGRRNGEWAFPMREVPNLLRQFPAEIQIAHRVLNMVAIGTVMGTKDSEKAAILHWALDWRIDPSKSKKLAKTLLKRFRTSLLLYNVFAQTEWRTGKVDDARKVFATALGMCGSFPEDSKRDKIILWKTWAWEEIMDGNYWQALRVLLSIPKGELIGVKTGNSEAFDSTVILRAKRFLQDEQDRFASLGLFQYAFAYNEALALVEYLTSSTSSVTTSFDVSGALSVHNSLLKEMKRRDLSSFILYEMGYCNGKIRLLYHHSRTAKLFRISLLREALEEAITETQKAGRSNTLLWCLYAWNEGRSRIEGRVKGWLRDSIHGYNGQNSTVAAWMFDTWTELRMNGEHTYAVRKILEDAVECQSTRSSIKIWKLYVEFELREKNHSRAKLILYRAMKCCPWAKELAMLAFTKLFTVLDFSELKKLFLITVLEKELRASDTTKVEDWLEEMSEERGRVLYPGIGGPGTPGTQLRIGDSRQMKLAEDPPSDSKMDEK
ncbi:NRDE-2, necessary for RNA interference-domain-containing protein [Kalaharituber pfeilii]|nr:NRDE-2, necessary for RNA interference-domain-containing protein [Kalaharituber pfeilii]